MEREAAMLENAVYPVVPAEAKSNTRETKASNSAQETPLEAAASMCVVLVIGLFIFGFVFQISIFHQARWRTRC